MFDKECAAFIRAGNRELPCREARQTFAKYVRDVTQDVCDNNPEADFSLVEAQMGGDAQVAAIDFLESREEATRWKALGRRRKRCLWFAGAVVAAAIVLFAVYYIRTGGFEIVTTKTTTIEYRDTDMTLEEMVEHSKKYLEQQKKEDREE